MNNTARLRDKNFFPRASGVDNTARLRDKKIYPKASRVGQHSKKNNKMPKSICVVPHSWSEG